ncbi:Mannosylfructose-phosphate synthase [Curvibacter sp. AEP1-3]|uniref:glycosyltransferase n=1 Tax=Curvibacter sp. AEP1-3 TaxID=1844971 RepID=UPI000B3C999F|nr:glycosyltransferase [Curvibacter sp. AEP1-3]ARV18658.1 Mannosylfructose-phosphate synthase [Curvibacter sp. AEP1-3]
MQQVLNISKHDTIGRRFNNLDAREGFEPYGWHARFACWSERNGPADVVQQASGVPRRSVTRALAKLGRYSGNINGYHRNAGAFVGLPFYQQADLLHFHIVHEEYLSVQDWVRIAAGKPVVWTWHDPYMFNGHCIYSMGCTGFETGCQRCDHLDYHFRVHRDRCARNLEEKRAAVKQIDPLVVLASDYMQDLVDRSVYRDFVRTRVVPFGVREVKALSMELARQRLGIPPHNIVVGFRAVYSDYKGIGLIQAALQRLSTRYPHTPLSVITFQEKGFCEGLSAQFQVIDAGWISDDAIEAYYAAMDFFLMPSRAEAFGLMAIEAMAAGACPVVTYGTALPDLVNAPLHGICSAHTEEDYAQTFEAAVFEHKHHAKRRIARQAYAAERYNLDLFCQRMSAIYNEEYEYHNRVRCAA